MGKRQKTIIWNTEMNINLITKKIIINSYIVIGEIKNNELIMNNVQI